MADALLFDIEDQTFALPLEDVREVLRAAMPMPLPRAPFGCLGLLDVRGEVVPVLDLAVMLGQRPPATRGAFSEQLLNSHLLVLEREQLPVALVVDRVLEVGHADAIQADAREMATQTLGKAAELFAGVVESG